MKRYFFYIKQKILLNLVKISCYLNIPFLSALGIYLSLFKSKKIQFEKNPKKTGIVFYKSGGIEDLESTFVNSKSKNKILYLNRELFRELNFFFINEYSQSMLKYKNSKKNIQYLIFLDNLLNWLNKFLNEIYFVSFNFSYPEEFYLKDVCFKKGIKYLIMYKECIRSEGNFEYVFGKFYKNTYSVNKNIHKISVYNEMTYKHLIKNNIFEKSQIKIVGMPRAMYSLEKNDYNKEKNITFFLISKKAGFPLKKNLLPKNLRNFDWDNLNMEILFALTKLSLKYPKIKIIVKGKSGALDEYSGLKKKFKNSKLNFLFGGAGHNLIKSSLLVIAFNSTTIFETILNKKKIIIPYFKKYRIKKLNKFVYNYPMSICVNNSAQLISNIEKLLNSNFNEKYNKKKNYNKLVYNYLGDIKKSRANMKNFLDI
jgi:hypothetical protein